jgi:hypothetical protein
MHGNVPPSIASAPPLHTLAWNIRTGYYKVPLFNTSGPKNFKADKFIFLGRNQPMSLKEKIRNKKEVNSERKMKRKEISRENRS